MSEQEFAASAADMLRWAESLSGIARTGLGFTQSLYEQERFEEVLKVAADIRHVAVEEAEAETLIERVRSACADQVAGRLGADLRVVGAAASPAQGETLHDALAAAQVAVGAA